MATICCALEKNIVSQFASTMSASDMSHAGAPRDPDHYTIKAGAMIFCGILMSLTAIFAVVEFSNRDLKDAFVRMDEKVERKFDHLNAKIDAVDRKVDTVDRKVDGLQIEMTHVKHRLDKVEQGLEKIEHRLNTVDQRLGKVQRHVEIMPPRPPAARSGLR